MFYFPNIPNEGRDKKQLQNKISQLNKIEFKE